jgi:hypothetical protein
MAKVQISDRQYYSNTRNIEPKKVDTGMSNILDKATKVASSIIQANAESGLNETLSQAQSELRVLTNDYRINNQSNPYDNQEFKQKRKDLFDRLKENISPLSRMEYISKTKQLEFNSDEDNNIWALKQTQQNVNTNLSNSIKNNLSNAFNMGVDYSDGTNSSLINVVKNYQTNYNDLLSFGSKHLGEENTKNILSSYESDYMKSFLSGVLEKNPVMAMKLMEDESVKASFGSDIDNYNRMKSMAKSRSLQLDEIRLVNEVTSTMTKESDLFSQSLERNLSLIEIEEATNGISPQAKAVILKMNGYSAESSDLSLSPADKIDIETKTYEKFKMLESKKEDLSKEDKELFKNELTQLVQMSAIKKDKAVSYLNKLYDSQQDIKEEKIILSPAEKLKNNMEFKSKFYVMIDDSDKMSAEELKRWQDNIFYNIDNGSLTKKEANDMLSLIVKPLSEKIELKAKNFNKNELGYNDNKLGFKDIENFYEDNIEKTSFWVNDKEEDFIEDYKNKISFYDSYFNNINQYMTDNGYSLSNISDMPILDKQKMIQEMSNKTIKDYATSLTGIRYDDIYKARSDIGLAVHNKVIKKANEEISKSYLNKNTNNDKINKPLNIGGYTIEIEE